MKKPVIFALLALILIPAIYCLIITLQSFSELLQCENTIGICGEAFLVIKLFGGPGILLWGLLSVCCYYYHTHVNRYLKYTSYGITALIGVIFVTAVVTG